MIGLLVTGHGNFASGITSAVNLIAGEQEDYQSVDFLATYNLDDLEKELRKALDNLKNCSGVLILCDLLGGTPFNKAVEISHKMENANVIAGVNLSMLLEVTMTRKFEENLDSLTTSALESGVEQMVKYEFINVEQQECEDGI